MMDLVRELLDIQVRDCRYRKCGRVDGIVMEISQSGPPVVTAIEIGGAVLAKRVGRWCAWLYQRLAPHVGLSITPIRIPIRHIAALDLQLTLDFDAAGSGRLLQAEEAVAAATGRTPRR